MPEAPQLLKIIQDNALKTDNHCGLTAVQLAHRSGTPLAEINAELNRLFKEKRIQVRDGIHGKLIFKKQ